VALRVFRGRLSVQAAAYVLECAIDASALLNAVLPHRLHVLTGPHCPEEIFSQLQQRVAAKPLISIERFTPDFPAYLQRADLSISMAGYNTCMDIVSAGVRAIVYPFTGNNNQEQMLRARKLEQLGCVTVLPPDQLNAEPLAAMMRQALQTPHTSAPLALDLHGAEKTAKVLAELLQA
jgi:predicted glycosyltransferase